MKPFPVVPAWSRSSVVFVAAWLFSCGAGARSSVPAAASPRLTPAALHVAPAPRVVTPAPPAPAVAEPNALPPLTATWGTADSLTFVAAAPDRRWVAVCQARHDTNGDGVVRVDVGTDGELRGDALEGYFVDAPGPGTPIDAFIGADPSGRFVALVREGRVLLRDTTTRVDIQLPADARDDLGPFAHPRAVSFDPTGQRLLYLQKPELGGRVVVRELATGAEAVIEVGQGSIWRADFDPSGEAVVVRAVVVDTNGNGRVEWPVQEAPKPWMRCTPPLPRFAMWERPGDDPVTRVAKAAGGPARDVPGLVVPMGDAVIMREADGALTRVDAAGKRAPVARKGCDARMLHVDASRGLVLLTCQDAKGKNDAVLVGQGPAKMLGLTLAAAPGDHWLEGTPRLIPLHPGSDAALLDLDRREVEMLTTGDRIIATSGARALVLRGKSLIVHELGGTDHDLGSDLLPLAHLARAGSVLFVPPYIVDLGRGEVLGRSEDRALAVSSDGAVLVSEGGTADAQHFARGPLRWKR